MSCELPDPVRLAHVLHAVVTREVAAMPAPAAPAAVATALLAVALNLAKDEAVAWLAAALYDAMGESYAVACVLRVGDQRRLAQRRAETTPRPLRFTVLQGGLDVAAAQAAAAPAKEEP